jgi:hypothetical protein
MPLRLPFTLETGRSEQLDIGLALESADMRNCKRIEVLAVLEPTEFGV